MSTNTFDDGHLYQSRRPPLLPITIVVITIPDGSFALSAADSICQDGKLGIKNSIDYAVCSTGGEIPESGAATMASMNHQLER